MAIVGSINKSAPLVGAVNGSSCLTGNINASIAIGQPVYDGPYEVEPAFEEQTLATKNKTLKEDVTVNAITVSRTSNQSGGKTIYIGGEINA